MKIVIDPGHGGPDPGAIGPSGVQEKVIALAIALRLVAILRPVARVIITRETDEDVSLQARADIADGAEALISIHCNAASNPESNGTETLYYPGSVMGRRLAECIQTQVVQELGMKNRGIKERPGLAVLRLTNAPAAILEIAFISNPTEEANLEDPKIHTRVAQAIARGTAEALGLKLPVAWDPAVELQKLRDDGLINTEKKPQDVVNWGELATVLNRMRRE